MTPHLSPLPPILCPPIGHPKGEDLKGRGGENTKKMNLFYLSSVAGFMSSFDSSLSCICNNKVLRKIIKKKRDY